MPPGLGPVHLLVVTVVALLVLGPEKLPQAARQAGKAMGEVQRWMRFAEDEARSVLSLDTAPEPEPDELPPSPPAARPRWVVDNWRSGDAKR